MSLPAKFGELLANARKSGQHVDYEIRCQGQAIKVHKLVVAIQSSILSRACAGPFKENRDGFYKVKDFSFENDGAEGDTKSLLFHADVFMFADKYAIKDLQTLALNKLDKVAKSRSDVASVFMALPAVYALEGEPPKMLRQALARNRKGAYRSNILYPRCQGGAGGGRAQEPSILSMAFRDALGRRAGSLAVVSVWPYREILLMWWLVDLYLLCELEMFGVHRIVLCSHSPVFRAALAGPFKEQADGVYEIKGSYISCVSQMISCTQARTKLQSKTPPRREKKAPTFDFMQEWLPWPIDTRFRLFTPSL
ncbi:BTB/POZ fold domain containing protein [Cordyceps fumosorosea ARSEF 2679]|uniref:BTB/POZ fold domain containing protein n=1 Tax=Cordyceps fumosorosea (strain ARSEF 2679) TaxID=1081104 RepID=A0A162MR16_CORFA|nr:BTB/POZ fold domain containing protein [Cordyceps fumosorosea ARSEF 2679]OAA68819.1 BTB/POZ fold domain containing protein [Cordyceps fumosorosea ARSEF 2679]